jgi:hypothetical protein
VRWKGYVEETWEPVEALTGCWDMVVEFEEWRARKGL